MLARLKNVFFPPPVPSAVLAVDDLDRGMIFFFHIVPEDGIIETLGFTSFSPTFRLYGTTEQAREQIGTVTLEAEGPFTFLNAVATRASKSWDCSPLSSPAQEQTDNVEAATQLAPDSLHRAAADAIPNQNEQACSVSATWRAGNAEVVTQLVEVLRQAALDVIRDGEEHPPSASTEAARTYPVFIVHVNRPKPGRITPAEPTSFPPFSLSSLLTGR